jgi:phosphopantothenoylcysteine decarboxylase/phosphopantothenate--cysteine ligase
MKCIVSAGPTYEPLDGVRRLTNFSTGRLGTELANYLAGRGHEVVLLAGEMGTWPGPRKAAKVKTFGTTANLAESFRALAAEKVDGIFHAAAVSDFAAGKTFQRSPAGEMIELKAGKLTTRGGNLLVELVPTPKIIYHLREWFPHALLVGWKYEVDGNRDDTISKARQQLAECKTNACVVNGPAYGLGFGLVTSQAEVPHYRAAETLFSTLHDLLC